MSKSIITESLYNQAISLINGGISVRAACTELNIPRTSFRRMMSSKGGIKLTNEIEYSILLKSKNVVFIIDGNFYPITYDTNEYNGKKSLIIDLCNRDSFMMNLDEQGKIIDGNLNSTVRKIINSCDEFDVKDGKFFYKGKEVTSEFFKILKRAAKNENSNLTKFANMLVENPDPRMILQLHGFIEHNDISIDKEGYVIAYKAVNINYKDYYSGKYDNSVGCVIEMDRSEVNDNPDETCSNGLHVGSMSYISQMYNPSSGRLVVCKIKPSDFVSIPTDYNFAKARVCKYEVIDELNK